MVLYCVDTKDAFRIQLEQTWVHTRKIFLVVVYQWKDVFAK